MPRRFLVTGCGRSGTTYTARLFDALGLACGHEQVFQPATLARSEVDWPASRPGEASWMGAPHLLSLPAGTVVLHQVRAPLAVARSFLRTRFFHQPSACPEHHALACATFPELRDGTPAERCLRYWLEWNLLAECAAEVEGLTYLRYRLEDIDDELVLALCAELEHEVAPEEVRSALSQLPRDVNTRGDRSEDALVWATFADRGLVAAARGLAESYGYDLERGTLCGPRLARTAAVEAVAPEEPIAPVR